MEDLTGARVVQAKMIINPNREEKEEEEENQMTGCEVEVTKEHVQGNTVKLIQQRAGTTIVSQTAGVKFRICSKREEIEPTLGMMRNIYTDGNRGQEIAKNKRY